ncbi:hypothetical protein P3T37_002247 [Kitasatospora sp. MAA4]|uniref:hypothetical protein n=1 Tax=Kitasatospora sp. MAA4 TaxID=3035093 RepID=UPI00247545F5|nr:hypothetical protein [Kitasatospora sp. MAA4]MDH6132861.1 hypothetical protein [Kitasatospora sp. MAA4]
MDHPHPAAPIAFTAEGLPYYATQPGPAPITLYQPAAGHPPVLVHQAPPAPTHYTPQTLPTPVGGGRDPWPARLLCGGIGIGAAGLGTGFLLQQIAAATTGLGCLAAILALLWLLKNTGGGRGGVNVTVNNRNR